jgi:signal transduction histidine kinase
VTCIARAADHSRIHRLGGRLKTRSTERYDLHARLARSEARFRDVIERNADAIVVVDVGAGDIRYVNRAAEELFGRSRENLLNEPFGFPLVSGETTELELGGNGHPRIVEMRVVESHWEERPALLASLRDVTERKEAEESAQRLIHERIARSAAEKSERRMRFLTDSMTLLASAPDYRAGLWALANLCVRELADWAIVYSLDGRGVVERLEVASREAGNQPIARQLQEESLGLESTHPVYEVLSSNRSLLVREVSPDFWPTLSEDAYYVDTMRRLGVTSFVIVPLVARGRAIGALSVKSTDRARLFDDDDVELMEELAQRAALALDNARLYAEARQAIRAQSDLIAMVSHDLRTPLTSMLGYAELLSLGIPEPLADGARKQVERILAAGRHLLYLIEQLTEFAKLEADAAKVGLVEVDVKEIVREVRVLVEPLARERGLQFHVEDEDSAGSVISQPGKLRQILLNLIGNAIKFTESGTVALRVRARDGELVFEVSDTGSGIDPQHLEEIFRP